VTVPKNDVAPVKHVFNPNPHGYGILRAPFSKTEISSA
jgi:hypothetical protein